MPAVRQILKTGARDGVRKRGGMLRRYEFILRARDDQNLGRPDQGELTGAVVKSRCLHGPDRLGQPGEIRGGRELGIIGGEAGPYLPQDRRIAGVLADTLQIHIGAERIDGAELIASVHAEHERRYGAVAPAYDCGSVQLQMIDHRSDILGQLIVAQRCRTQGAATVAPAVNEDDLIAGVKESGDLSAPGLMAGQSSVQQDHRGTAADHAVPEMGP